MDGVDGWGGGDSTPGGVGGTTTGLHLAQRIESNPEIEGFVFPSKLREESSSSFSLSLSLFFLFFPLCQSLFFFLVFCFCCCLFAYLFLFGLVVRKGLHVLERYIIIIIIIDNFCKALFSGVNKLTALYNILQYTAAHPKQCVTLWCSYIQEGRLKTASWTQPPQRPHTIW